MKKSLLFALVLLGFLLTVHDAHAQSGWGYDPGEARMRYTHEACAQMPLLACQQFVLQHVIGVQPYGYYGGYGYNRYNRNRGGTGELLKDALLAGGGYVVGRWDEKRRQENRREMSRQMPRPQVYEEEAVRMQVEDNKSSESTLNVVNQTGLNVQFTVWRNGRREVRNVSAGQTVGISSGDRYEAVINYNGRMFKADVVFHPERDRTLVLIAPTA